MVEMPEKFLCTAVPMKDCLALVHIQVHFSSVKAKGVPYDCTGASESKTLNHRINSPVFSLHQPTSITVGLNSFLKFLS